MHRPLTAAAFAVATIIAGCASPPAAPPAPAPLPTSIDLRPRLLELGLAPRPQGARGTCSIFTTVEAIEFAHAKRSASGKPARLSPEFLNWAASQAAGRPSDGNFFHNALAGFEKHGLCPESVMPYQPTFDRRRAPPQAALDQAAQLRDDSRGTLAIHWIVPWQAGHVGVTPDQLTEIKRVLAMGYPVAAGSGHSRLLVGYRDDPALPAAGTFLTEDSALNRFDEVTYDFVRTQVNDVFWVEVVTPPASRPRS